MRYVVAYGYYPDGCEEFKVGFHHFSADDREAAIIRAESIVAQTKKELAPLCADLRHGCFMASLFLERRN